MTTANFSALIEPSTLKALLLFASKQDARFYLNGVYFETTTSGTYAVATNGHCLAVAKISKETDKQPANVLIHRDIIENVLKGNKNAISLNQVAGDKVEIVTLNGTMIVPTMIDSYPDWRRVTTAPQTGERGYFHPDYLALVNKAGQIINKRINPYVVQQNGGSVGYCNLNDVVHAYVMPVRGYGEVVSAPTWY
jgi:hypothetical protein